MIIPSIDLVAGQAVQLIGGETLAIEAGDPKPLLQRFSRVGEVAVIDIDAARGDSGNAALIRDLCRIAPIRVGGGIRDLQTAVGWLDAGAEKIIIGTAAQPELLAALPKDRVIVALDAIEGQVVTHGWRTRSGLDLLTRIEELRSLCGGFLVTFVEREGRLSGTDLGRAAEVIRAAGDTRVTIAGGVTTASEIADLDAMGADAQVGMAIYNGDLELADAFTAPLVSDRTDGLWPTVVVDESGFALGLVWSNRESVGSTLETGRGTYHSRKRALWVKGETSGATQEVISMAVDCDRDALRFTVRQNPPGFCHQETWSCWGEDRGLSRLSRRLERIVADRPEGSNTALLVSDPQLLAAKIREEADELTAATEPNHVANEAADLIYFTMAKAATARVGLGEIDRVLDQRERRVTRRPMKPKESK